MRCTSRDRCWQCKIFINAKNIHSAQKSNQSQLECYLGFDHGIYLAGCYKRGPISRTLFVSSLFKGIVRPTLTSSQIKGVRFFLFMDDVLGQTQYVHQRAVSYYLIYVDISYVFSFTVILTLHCKRLLNRAMDSVLCK